jgi:hypothetical protein
VTRIVNICRCVKALGWAAGLVPVFLLSGCSSTPVTHAVRFREAARTDVVVMFSSWDLITITKPDTREDGFLPLFHRPEAEKILAQPGIPRNLAVVICGFTYNRQQETEQQAAWASIFSDLGFQRLVFVRPPWNKKLNGAVVMKDVQLGSSPIPGG